MTGTSPSVSSDPETAAQDWLFLLQSGQATEADHAALARWRLENPAHEAAYAEAQRTWALLGGLGATAAQAEASLPTLRGPAVSWPWAIAASLAVFALVSAMFSSFETWFADAHTAPGETRKLTLADGSHVWLNGGTTLSYTIDAHTRQVRLLQGEAYFEVVHDASKPFTVLAGPASLKDIGTKFDVSREGERVALTVTEGVVGAGAGEASETRVTAAQSLVWHGETPSPVASADVQATLGWQRGRFVFKARPLGEVVAELSRYRRGYILVVNGALRDREVTGVFDSAHPDAVLDAIAHALPARVVRITSYLTIIG